MRSSGPDVLIAGGGPAGSCLAILLGRVGLSVELFERSHFPREKPCGEGLMPAGVAVLSRLGLLEILGGAPFRGVRYHFGRRTAEGRFPQLAGLPLSGRGLRRRDLDRTLFETAARTPGVAAYAGVRVEAPLKEDGRVVGLMVNGEPRRAPLVVAADGVHSRLRHLLGLDVPLRRGRFGVRAHFRLAPGREQPPWVDVFVGGGYELYVTPLPGREILVAGLAGEKCSAESIDAVFRRWRSNHAVLTERLKDAEQLTPLQGVSPLSARARSGVAPGVVLLGDAAGAVDPITGGGITQALLSAELLTGYILRHGLRDSSWLGQFEYSRRALLRDYRFLTRMVLWFADHPRLGARAVSLLRTWPALFSHLVGVSGGLHGLLAIPGFSVRSARELARWIVWPSDDREKSNGSGLKLRGTDGCGTA